MLSSPNISSEGNKRLFRCYLPQNILNIIKFHQISYRNNKRSDERIFRFRPKNWLNEIENRSLGGFYEWYSMKNVQNYIDNYLTPGIKYYGSSTAKLFDGGIVKDASRGRNSPFYWSFSIHTNGSAWGNKNKNAKKTDGRNRKNRSVTWWKRIQSHTGQPETQPTIVSLAEYDTLPGIGHCCCWADVLCSGWTNRGLYLIQSRREQMWWVWWWRINIELSYSSTTVSYRYMVAGRNNNFLCKVEPWKKTSALLESLWILVKTIEGLTWGQALSDMPAWQIDSDKWATL